MTKLFDAAIAKVQALPDSIQDEAAEVLFTLASRQESPVALDNETKAAILEGLGQLRRGDYANPEDIERLLGKRSR